MKTLYLHIGTPKTGTTSIQHFCKHNEKVLAGKGICYPLFDFKYLDSGNSRNGLFLQNAYYNEKKKVPPLLVFQSVTYYVFYSIYAEKRYNIQKVTVLIS